MYGGRFDGTDDMDVKEYVGMEWERDVPGCKISSIRLLRKNA
jgi:hypothetical protein